MQLQTLNYRRLYEAFNYRLRTFAGGRMATLCRPTAIALLMTERCNARLEADVPHHYKLRQLKL